MVLLFVTITINIIINIRYRCLFSGRKSTSSKFLLFIFLFFTLKNRKGIFYIMQVAYIPMNSVKCGILTALYGNFRKCGTRFYPVRCGTRF